MEMINTFPELLRAMESCYQFENINMVDHGKMVSNEYINILKGWHKNDIPPRLTELIGSATLPPRGLMTRYQILHDCGKPLCRLVDDANKVHYPNHAEVSAQQLEHLFPDEKDLHFLVKHDMDFHTMKTCDLNDLARHKYGFALYLTAWAELFANASMFGGVESVSYKIKKKKLIKHLKLFDGVL